MRTTCAHSTALAALALLGAACASTISPPAQVIATVPAPAPATATPPPEQLHRLAVLPLQDDELFRAERAALRLELAGYLARLSPDHEIVPLADVDAKLRPVSRSTGHPCAFEDEPAERRAQEEGWRITRITHVAGIKGGSGEALWIDIAEHDYIPATFEAPWNRKLPIVDRYRAAFAALVRGDGGGLVGGLGMTHDYRDGALHEGPVTLCERDSFRCAGSADWKDHAAELAACFAGGDEVWEELLVQGDAGGRWCEIQNLDRKDSREGAREACLCKALAASSAMGQRPGRRTVAVHYEAPDLSGKPRPELRLVESSTNLVTEDEWHSMGTVVDGKPKYSSVRRLVTDNLDALAAPLARCSPPPGSVVVADIDVREDGVPAGGRIVTGAPDSATARCLEQALGRGAFLCTDDGKQARLRIAIEWPGR
jgi:hypothetical protein